MQTSRVKRVKTPEQALSSMMNLCARAEKSSGDALRLMRGWGLESDDALRVLETLMKERFIDDERYASAFVREKLNLSGWGAYKIKSALIAKGISRDIIDQVLGEYDPQSIDGRLDDYLKRRLPKLKGTEYEVKAKLVRYGASLGYDFQTVISAVERLT